MIIGKYAVPPMHVRFGSTRFDADTGLTEVAIYLDDETVLTQWLSKADEAKAMMIKIDECIDIAEEAQRDIIAAGGADAE